MYNLIIYISIDKTEMTGLLALFIVLAVNTLGAQSVGTDHLPRTNLLSRTRRFIFDDPNSWEGEVALALNIPIGALGTSLGLSLPFVFTLGGESSER